MSDLNLAIKLSTKGSQIVVKDLHKVQQSADQLSDLLNRTAQSGKTAQHGLLQARTGAAQLDKQAHKTSITLSDLVLRAHAMALAYVGVAGAMNSLKKADAFNVLTQRIKTATKDTNDFKQVFSELYSIAQKNGAEFEATVSLFQNLSSSREDLKATNSQMLTLVDTVQKIGVIGGSSSEAMKNGLLQLSQAMSGGIVRAEEFNSIVENIPELANRIAKGLGKTKGELRQMVVSGKLLSSQVFNVILQQSEQVAKDFDGIALSLDRAGQQASTSFSAALSKLDQSVGLTTSLASVLVDISNTLDEMDASELQNVVASLVAIGGGTLALGALKKYGVNIAAMAISTGAYVKSLTQIPAYASPAAVQTNYLGQVIGNTAAKTGVLATAIRGLGVATRFMLGPVGLAIAAGWALYEAFKPEKIEKAASATDKLAKANQKIADTNQSAVDPLQNAYQNRAKLIVQAEVMKRSLADIVAQYGQESVQAQTYRQALKTVNDELANQQRFIDSILLGQQLQAEALEKQKQAEQAKAGGEQALATMQQKIALFGKQTELQKINAQIESGNLKGVSDQLANQLRLQAKKIDLLNQEQSAQQAAKNLNDTATQYAQTLERTIALSQTKSEVAKLNWEIEHGSLQGINDELRTHLQLLAEKADKTTALNEQQLPFWEQMQEHIGNTSEQFDTMWGNTFDRFAQGIGDATATAIIEGKSFGDVMRTIARSAIKEVISGLVQIGVKKLALAGIERMINKTAAASAAGVMAANAAATSTQAGLNAFSSTAAIPIVGPLMAPGAMAAALAITAPMAGAVAASSAAMVGMAHDGMTEIPREGTWLLDKGERVVDSRTNADLKQALASGSLSGGNTTSINYAPVISVKDPNEFKDLLSEHADHLYSLHKEAQLDRGEV